MSGAYTGDTSMLIDEDGNVYTLRLRRDNNTIRVTYFDGDNVGVFLGDFNDPAAARAAVDNHDPWYTEHEPATPVVSPEVQEILDAFGDEYVPNN